MENQNNNISNQGYPQQYFQELKRSIDGLDCQKIHKIAEIIFDAYKNDKQIFVIGNGGSATTASHFACDLGKGTLKNVYEPYEKRFKVISLTDNVATLIAYGNDLSFEDIFEQQLKNLINAGDVVIGLSGSGNSSNVIKAMIYAKICDAKTVGLLGFHTGGKLAGVVDCEITIPDSHYGRIEDIHLVLCHLISDVVFEMKERNKKNKLS